MNSFYEYFRYKIQILVKVVDFACKGDFKCSSFVETYEEEIEDWWKSGPDSGENARPEYELN